MIDNVLNALVLQTASLYQQRDQENLKSWIFSFSSWLGKTKSLTKDFNILQNSMMQQSIDFQVFLSDVAYLSFDLSCEQEFGDLCWFAANLTKQNYFYFYAAWTSFNIDDFENCQLRAMACDEEYAPLYTLSGQAALDSGKPRDAEAFFRRSANIDPSDLLTYFQLAKSFWVQEKYIETIETLLTCLQLDPKNEEVILFLSKIPLEDLGSKHLNQIKQVFKDNLNYLRKDKDLAKNFLNIILIDQDIKSLKFFIDFINVENILHPVQDGKMISSLLKILGEKENHHYAVTVIDGFLSQLVQD